MAARPHRGQTPAPFPDISGRLRRSTTATTGRRGRNEKDVPLVALCMACPATVHFGPGTEDSKYANGTCTIRCYWARRLLSRRRERPRGRGRASVAAFQPVDVSRRRGWCLTAVSLGRRSRCVTATTAPVSSDLTCQSLSMRSVKPKEPTTTPSIGMPPSAVPSIHTASPAERSTFNHTATWSAPRVILPLGSQRTALFADQGGIKCRKLIYPGLRASVPFTHAQGSRRPPDPMRAIRRIGPNHRVIGLCAWRLSSSPTRHDAGRDRRPRLPFPPSSSPDPTVFGWRRKRPS